MARHQGKASTSKSVTQHQLFPAVIALWFGALLGLGSLALRPSLIEKLVIMSRIDLIVPAAAPPLGITARTILALGLTALGAIIGTLIARRLARTGRAKSESADSAIAAYEQPAAQQDTPAAEPVHAGNSFAPQRRRALTIEPNEEAFVPFEIAPLPGGAPQILDIAAIKADMREREESATPIEEGSAPSVDPAPANSPLPSSEAPEPAGINAAPPAPSEPDLAATAAVSEPQRQAFGQRLKAARESALASPDQALETNHSTGAQSANADLDDRQVFGMAPSGNPPPDKPRQIFGEIGQAAASIDDDAPLPSLSSMEMADLVARLAESMRRRRAVRTEAESETAAALDVEQPALLAEGAVPAALDPLDLLGFEDPAEAEAEAIPEGDYGSLLRINQAASRTGVASIDEPESSNPDIEPVMIFPGQAPRHDQTIGGAAPGKAEGQAEGADAEPVRQADTPLSSGQDQAVAAPDAGAALDPDAADQALRSALAKLQRMSGAA